MRTNPRLGYGMAALAAGISGVSIYFNSLGVGGVIRDATLYTTLKNSVVGAIVLAPVLALGSRRAELRRLGRRRWAWLGALALIGGSVPYVLFFEGLRLTTAATGSLLNHLQFAFAAVLAVLFLGERLAPRLWVAVAAILAASFVGVNLDALRLGRGALLVLGSSLLFAAGFVIARHVLRELSTTTVMAAKMTGGSLLLLGYSALSGHLAPAARLSVLQWEWVLATGLVLLAFTAAILVAIRHAPVTAVLAVGTAAPLVTLALQAAGGTFPRLAPGAALSLAVTVTGALAIAILGPRRERVRAA